MAKKKFEKEKELKLPLLRQETKSTAIAILFFLLAIFFILAPFAKAGVAGDAIYYGLNTLLGYGFFLIPILFVLLGISFMRALNPNLATRSIVGSLLFVVSGLGLLALIPEATHGGILGQIISYPLLKFFDIYFTIVFLLGVLAISVFILFDTAPRGEHFAFLKEKLFKKKEPLLTEASAEPEKEIIPPPPDPIPAPTPEEKTLEVPEEKTSAVKEFFGFGKKEENEQEEKTESTKPVFQLKEFVPPPISLLEEDVLRRGTVDTKASSNIIQHTLQNFGIMVEMDEVSVGPSVTRYALKPAEGVKLSRIESLQNELALALAAHPVRIEAPIPGTSLVGVEVPNSAKSTVGLGTLLSSPDFTESSKPLLVSLGKSISGKIHFGNIAKMPHLLIAGTTGSGKSVAVLSMITSLLYRNSPENLKLILIDPKRVTLPMFNGIPHLYTPVITDGKKAIGALNWAMREMDRRYLILEKYQQTDIQKYHEEIWGEYVKKKLEKSSEENDDEEDIEEDEKEAPVKMPYIVIMIDELADLMHTFPKELESTIVRLAQMSRAVGIHLVLSTQRPSVNVITGLIKANIPSRIALRVISQIDSRTILDTKGAENLLGSGDMLYQGDGMSKPIRLQSAFVSDAEIKKVVKYITNEYRDVPPEYIEIVDVPGRDTIYSSNIESDEDEEFYEEVKEEVISAGKASTSYLQRKFGLGYGRAAKLIDLLEKRGVVGPANGSKPREILVGTGSEEGNESMEI